ncbi:glycosyltransferase [Alteromonas sp. 345S023]|uniref:Glycosyltransferase n=1 Tax=Alteromonas profundi TaxID=2696062 RepID=A0A7X5LN44_9ALTE|nr:glycosyltransferase [Alteromonas profundi]NDV91690.1 glycosyltransferase [Alteromonas profundi]
MNKHVLIVSPIPSHPQFQGNSARIFRLNRMFQQTGYHVHFLYFGMEGLSEEQRRDMEQQWDYFHFIKPEGPAAEPSFGDYFDIDDWYDDRVSDYVDELSQQWHFDVCVTNYVWFSKVLDVLPETTQKVIDTHDVFGDRHIVAKEAGLEPVWFYTTKELEAHALARADLVLAIQDEEKAYFESITRTPVEVMGYVVPNQPLVSNKNDKLTIGYIGSGNPFNIESLRVFQQAVMENPSLMQSFNFLLGGTVCKAFSEMNEIFDIVGMVDDLDEFYRQIDIAINPMVGGTGLKIKSLEALAYNKPLLATNDAMVGIPSKDPYHKAASIEVMVENLCALDDSRYELLAKNSKDVFQQYNVRHISNFINLFG